MILAMVIIGGITRLTGSGLSMVEWHPFMGAFPPISEADWQEVFAKYKETPQYLKVNDWMQLSDFKSIFWWEYIHRLWGRLIGAAFFFPWLYFLIRKRMTARFAKKTLVAFFLGMLQGVLGWYMVSSGLVDRPEVSHHRLTAHLCLAFAVGMYLLWLMLDARPQVTDRPSDRGTGLRRATWAFIGLLSIQIVWGGFMAGTRAGLLYPTFPDMHGTFMPAAVGEFDSWLADLADNPHTIHFVHRLLAYLCVLAAAAIWFWGRRHVLTPRARLALHALGAGTVIQFVLGVLTVIMHVPTATAVKHQAGAYLLLSVAVVLVHTLRADRRRPHPSGASKSHQEGLDNGQRDKSG